MRCLLRRSSRCMDASELLAFYLNVPPAELLIALELCCK